MSLSYELILETELEPIQLMNVLAKDDELKWVGMNLVGLGITINLYEHLQEDLDEDSEEISYYNLLRLTPDVVIVISIDSSTDYKRSINTLIRSSIGLLKEITANAVLLFNYETIVFHKFDSHLVFNQQMWEPYIESELKNLNIQYELKKLESPLL